MSEDITTFAKIMAAVGELYDKNISDEMVELYFRSLQQFKTSEIKTAFRRHVENPDGGQFFPKPADIVRYIKGSHGSRALRAWSKVEKAIRQVGSYETVIFDDPIIHLVIDEMGGWINFCAGTERDMNFKANEFEKRYERESYSDSRPYPRRLVGRMERDNIGSGYEHTGNPVLIGDKEKARLVYKNGENYALKTALLNLNDNQTLRMGESK